MSANHRCYSIVVNERKRVLNKIKDVAGTSVSIKITLRSQLQAMLALLDNWSKVDTKPPMINHRGSSLKLLTKYHNSLTKFVQKKGPKGPF
nr:MAG TPA: hypothetical protein [Caudoviricetes sp.]